MMKKLFKNSFGIRTQVAVSEKIFLGLIPIVFLLLIWFVATKGTNRTLTLPYGEFEGMEKEPPQEGYRFKRDKRMFVKNWKKEDKEVSKDKWVEFISAEGVKPIQVSGFRAAPIRDGSGIKIILPPGKIKKIIYGDSELKVGSTGTPSVGIEEKATSKSIMMNYQFESVESRILSPTIIPSPAETIRSLPSLWQDRKLPLNLLNSFLRVSGGFLVAFIIVFPIALLMGTFSKFEALFSPLMVFGGYLPIPALVPLTMSLFGTDEKQKIMFLALAFGIYLLPLFVQTLKDIDNVYLQTGYTLGATRFQILNKILLPIAMPRIFDAMRLGFGIGWGYIILAEMVDMGSEGVGALILISQRRGPREDIYLVLIAIVVMAFITDKIWEKVGKELFPYRSQER